MASSYPRVNYELHRPEEIWSLIGILPDGKLTTSLYDSASFKDYEDFVSVEELVMVSAERVLLWRLPKTETDWRIVGGKLFEKISHKKQKIAFLVDQLSPEAVGALSYGFRLRSWRFETYHTSFRPLPPIVCPEVVFVTPYAHTLAQAKDEAVISSVHWARQLSNQPGNVIYPESMVQHVRELESFGIEVKVLDYPTLCEQGFGALVGVGQGSVHLPYVVSLLWRGHPKKNFQENPPLAFVGKGVTFDSGGLSLKPAGSMEDMKLDKTGAVVVCGLLRALAMRKAPVNAVAIVAIVENMPSGSAQRPGDIVTSLSGQTIEVLNTDAEGRLILADALTYAQKTYSPSIMIDVATLTGAVGVALGQVYGGLFSNTKKLSDELIIAGEQVGEWLWPLPLHKEYDKALNSDNADMKNIANRGKAGASIAAQFLKRFIVEPVQWAHLDIACVSCFEKDSPFGSKGGNVFGIQLLDQWVRTYEASQED